MRFEQAFKNEIIRDGNSYAIRIPMDRIKNGNNGKGYKLGETLDVYVKSSEIQRGGKNGRRKTER